MNRALYPDNWEEIAAQCKAEAGYCCEECGAPNGMTVCHHKTEPTRWINVAGIDTELLSPQWDKPVLVQLGVAHLDQNPGNNERANLKVLCRGCHLRYDAPFHSAKAQKTIKRKKAEVALEAGQLLMFRESSHDQ
jgi:5-methylcytosine-specific restriction endonuclease McrA